MEKNVMHLRRCHILMLLSVSVLAIGLAACGGNSSSSSTTSSTATSTGGAASTVSTKSISGVGSVLVDAKGDALYTNNQDSGSKIACTGSCTSIWLPLTAPSGGQPTSDNASVQAKLGVVKGRNQPGHIRRQAPVPIRARQPRPGDGQRSDGQLRRHQLHLDRGDGSRRNAEPQHHHQHRINWQQLLGRIPSPVCDAQRRAPS